MFSPLSICLPVGYQFFPKYAALPLKRPRYFGDPSGVEKDLYMEN